MLEQLKGNDLHMHVKILGWLFIVANAIFVLVGGLALFLLVGIGAFLGDAEAFGILTVVGVTTGLFLAALGLPGMVGGAALLAKKGWGRILTLVIAGLGLLNFPIGTAVGLYALWVLLQQEADLYFTGMALNHREITT